MDKYWQIKAMALESQLRLFELQKSAAEIIERKRIAFELVGLDHEKKYKFDDDAESIEED
jgi:hypothetical protein